MTQLRRQRDRVEEEATTTRQSLERVEETMEQLPQLASSQLSSAQRLVQTETALKSATQAEEQQRRETRRLERQRTTLREQVLVKERSHVGDSAAEERRRGRGGVEGDERGCGEPKGSDSASEAAARDGGEAREAATK